MSEPKEVESRGLLSPREVKRPSLMFEKDHWIEYANYLERDVEQLKASLLREQKLKELLVEAWIHVPQSESELSGEIKAAVKGE